MNIVSWFKLFPESNKATRRRASAEEYGQRSPQTQVPPGLEVLEDRTVPSVVTWIGGSGDWDTASNWLNASTGTNQVPGSRR